MASSSSSSAVAASTITRPRIAIALTSAIAVASLGYYYYRLRYSAEGPDFDAPDPDSRLHRSNALRRARRSDRRRDDSSSSGYLDEPQTFSPPLNAADLEPGIASLSAALQDAQPDDWFSDSRDRRQRTGENIVTLLFRVSEDNARRNAYVHRGCLCNGCGMLPIRGIRYRCANCPDFDLCETCESQGVHNKSHVFYKVRIPVPSSAARHVQPPWYPGDPSNAMQNPPKDLLGGWASETGFERVELEALWEQWTFMANTEWRDDPAGLGLAMDRKTFERCLVPSAGYRHPAPNLIHDRMFAFYDTNNDGLIGFEEYLRAVSYKRRKDKLKRMFDGYDIDGDGYVNRRDFLRMFRAYYVSYKQMHRDTVEGLDDYMVTNTEVHQLVSGRQPISSLFGRDQRIPDADGGRMIQGKILRSNGEVDVPDGKGAVKEDKPDVANREDILGDLLLRNNNPSLFTESFGTSSRQPHSPARDSSYWAGILDPPRNTVDLTALLSGDNIPLDDLLHSIRSRRASTAFVADDDETSSSDEDDTPYDDQEGDDDETSPPPTNSNANHPVLQESIDAAEFMGRIPTEIRFLPQRDTFSNPQQMYSDKRKRILIRKQLYERWKRRQFYLDEEEGGVPPQGWRDDQDILANSNENAESSKPAPPLLSPRSRSSSKVRFAEDTDDFETRSNHSTSSRSVPERWGGMEIPDAERDAGKEILYQIAQQAFNELLDPLFKKKEDMAVRAAETKEQREKYRHFVNNVELQDEEEKSAEFQRPAASRQASAGRPIQQQNLQELLSTSGYTVMNSDATYGGGSGEVVDPDSRGHGDRTTTRQSAGATSPRDSSLLAPDHRDPTMPQFMPNSTSTEGPDPSPPTPGDNGGVEHYSASAMETPRTLANGQGTSASEPSIARSDTPGHVPRSTLVTYKMLDQAEQEARERGGWGRLSYAEFEEIYREHEFHDGSKNRLAYLGSWIDFCIPS